MDGCVQATDVISQSVIYDLLPEARSRLTTIYMTTYFIGGALAQWWVVRTAARASRAPRTRA